MKELKQVGLKVTIPRVTILELLQNADDHHFSAEDVFSTLRERGHDIGLATVYRVLAQFEQAGLLNKLNFENGQAMYEIDTGDHHDHIICTKCNKIIEFFDQKLENQQTQIAKENGFTLEDHNMVLYGICQNKNCSNKK
ncbi:ferric iron uptake transcriptional regulator [Ostreibacterium oceani]|uniref:Ferric uptake regulation protein n=1 Tax=Ostreibacterium oceani TaxID=2654998 RepID=A0A6N7ETZ8_9GAMM|nr:ferric iron uptake transcriptional regulator [Ostreibacterium oceani]MPV86294.1 ferric iron uptake transcriptional regulator [Ostreibacterium oceani]